MTLSLPAATPVNAQSALPAMTGVGEASWSASAASTAQSAQGDFALRLDARMRDLLPAEHLQPKSSGLTRPVDAVTGPSQPVPAGSIPPAPTECQRIAPPALTSHLQFEPLPAPPTVHGSAPGISRLQNTARALRETFDWIENGHAEIRRRGLPSDHELVTQFRDTERQRLLFLQMELGAAQFQMELVSKVVEHATGGARQVLQTQA